jgi:FSR family fosmidomycin resistance protein-like MFS transporter
LSSGSNERKVIATALAAHFLDHVCEMAFPAVMILVSLEFFGRPDSFEKLGMAYFAASLLFGLAAIPAGRLVDWIGTRRMLIIYSFGSAISLFLIGRAPSFPLLVLTLSLLGLFAGLYHPTGNTFISFGTRLHGRSMGWHGVGGSFGLAVSPFLVGALARWLGWRDAFSVLSLAPLLLGILVWRGGVNVEARDFSPALRDDQGHSRPYLFLPLILLFLLSMFNGMCYRGLMTFLPTFFIEKVNIGYLHMEGVVKGGFLTTLVLFLGMFGQFIGGRLADRVNKEMLYTGVFVVACPLLFLIAYLQGLVLVISLMCFAFIYFASQPVGNALLPRYTTAGFRGRIFGLFFFMNFGFGSFMSWLAGWIGERWDLTNIFTVLSACLLMAVCMGVALIVAAPRRSQTNELEQKQGQSV